jgi:3-oxoadipate enol-lactonase
LSELVATRRGSFLVQASGRPEAPPVVLVAGLGDDHSSWDDAAALLAASHRVIAFDNRGIGRSPITPGPYSVKEMADDAHDVVSALGLGRVSTVGSSMGGAICQEWALAHPDAIDRMVLSNTWGHSDRWFSGLLEHWIELAGRGSGRDLLFQLALFCFSPEHMERHPETIEEFLDAPIPNLDGFRSAARACQHHHAADRLRAIEAPTLVLVGEHDILTRPELSHRLAGAIPGASVSLLPAGHMTFWEQPQRWATAVTEFLSGSS